MELTSRSIWKDVGKLYEKSQSIRNGLMLKIKIKPNWLSIWAFMDQDINQTNYDSKSLVFHSQFGKTWENEIQNLIDSLNVYNRNYD